MISNMLIWTNQFIKNNKIKNFTLYYFNQNLFNINLNIYIYIINKNIYVHTTLITWKFYQDLNLRFQGDNPLLLPSNLSQP
jgi:hypothetical protein